MNGQESVGTLQQEVEVTAPEGVVGEDLSLVVEPVLPIAGALVADSISDERVGQIMEDGGYGVEVSSISDSLLVAEDNAVPVPYGERVWGPVEQAPGLIDLGADLMELVSAYPDNLSEVAFSSDDSFLEIYVKDPEGLGVSDVAKLVENLGMAGRVVIVPVTHSRSEMETAKDAIIEAGEHNLAVSADYIQDMIIATPNTKKVETELESVTDDEGEVPLIDLIDTPSASTSGTALDETIADVDVLVLPYEEIEDAGRRNDSSPFSMGADIGYSKNGGFASCSLGIPVVLWNMYMVLTAGHCGVAKFYTPNNNYVGYTRANTLEAGNGAKYGDWQVLSGANYRLQVWNSTISNQLGTTVPIVGARWDALARGSNLCTSGRTTGQVCRYRVDQPDQKNLWSSYNGNGYAPGMITSMSHETVQGTWDTNGFQGGDSGGPVYYNNNYDQMIMVGIVKGHSDNRYSYYFTRLEGVRAAYPSIYVG